MPTCPNGHQSAADDWCEVCGHRMNGASAAPAGAVPPPPPPPPAAPGGYGYPGPPGPPGPPGSAPPGGPGGPGGPGQGYGYPGPGAPAPGQGPAPSQPELCPQCGTPREVQAPFCEECRYNFLTHSPTTYQPPTPQHPGAPGGFPGQQGQQAHPPMRPYPGGPGGGQGGQEPGFVYERSGPSEINRPAEPLDPNSAYSGQQDSSQPSGDWVLSPPGGGQREQEQAPHHGLPPAPPHPHQPHTPDGSPPRQPGPPGLPGMGAPGQQQGQPGEFPQGGYGQQGQQPDYGQRGDFGHQGQEYGQQEYGQQAPPQGGGSWLAVIAPDRAYFAAMMGRSGPEAAALNLPAYSPEQQLPLTGPQITIGRRRASTGEAPDIDLGRAPEDPGVSHQHAVLVQQPDGTWSVVDQDSTNGTTINGAEDPIQPYVPVPLTEGDQVHVGAWTTITLHRS